MFLGLGAIDEEEEAGVSRYITTARGLIGSGGDLNVEKDSCERIAPAVAVVLLVSASPGAGSGFPIMDMILVGGLDITSVLAII